MTPLLNKLQGRGLIHDISNHDELNKLLTESSVTFYCGFDPTADSLHVGSMLPLLMMRRFQLAGHTPLVVLGSATGMIGDPSGKSAERTLLDSEIIQHNLEGIKNQIAVFLSSDGENATEFLRNDKWLKDLNVVEFLRDIGKHFSVNQMMTKDSVKSRLEDREQGISYTEFSYMLLQAYDFYWLYKNRNCRLQIGGSDQWGNITAGIDFTRRKTEFSSSPVFGLTFPLLTTSTGTKFGKTEGGTIWLDAERTSSYRFYQFWLNTPDADVINYLLLFTEIDGEELKALQQSLVDKPESRLAQEALAKSVTTLVHGDSETEQAITASKALFGGKITDIDNQTLLDIFGDVPSTSIKRENLESGLAILDLLQQCKLASSKGEARRFITGGGVYINNERVTDTSLSIGSAHLATENMMVLRVGKKKYHLVCVEE